MSHLLNPGSRCDAEQFSRITVEDPVLDIRERFRLVVIAQEAATPEVRRWALDTLERATIPEHLFKVSAL